MAKEVFIPKLGQTMEEVTLMNWLVQDGQRVEKGTPVLSVETDKAVFDIEAPASGVLHTGPYEAGQVVPVLEVVAIIGKPEDVFSKSGQESTPVSANSSGEESQTAATLTQPAPQPSAGQSASEKQFVSPRAKRLANARHVDLSRVPASGNGGQRIIEQDVLNYLESQPKASPVARRVAQETGINLNGLSGSGPQGMVMKKDVLPAFPAPQPAPISGNDEVLESRPLSGVRAVIANRMSQSAHTAAPVTLLMETSADALVAWREKLKARYAQEWGFAPGYNELFARITAAALRKHPAMNTRLNGSMVEVLRHANIGIAVDTDRGLIVPVLKDADQRSIQSLGKELRELVQKARAGGLAPDEMSGGTFTITNLGMYDVMAFTPVINLPEVAILGIGAIRKVPELQNGQWVETQKLILSLVFDHRLVDGAPAARFLQTVKEYVENPDLLVA